MLKTEQNWGKITNYPPMLNKDLHYWVGKVVQRKSRLRKTINFNEPQNQLALAYNRLAQPFNCYEPFL